jgi:hypothetical protein
MARCPCLRKSTWLVCNDIPHALHCGRPSSSLRHSGVVLVPQFRQLIPCGVAAAPAASASAPSGVPSLLVSSSPLSLALFNPVPAYAGDSPLDAVPCCHNPFPLADGAADDARSIPSATPAFRAVVEYAEAASELLNVGQPSHPALPPAPLHLPSPGQVPRGGAQSAAAVLAPAFGEALAIR